MVGRFPAGKKQLWVMWGGKKAVSQRGTGKELWAREEPWTFIRERGGKERKKVKLRPLFGTGPLNYSLVGLGHS